MTSSNAQEPALRHILRSSAAALALLVLAACGSSGGGGSSTSASGGSSSGSVAACEANLPVVQQTASNQMQVVVDGGPCASFALSAGAAPTVQQVGFFNAAYTTVTVCVPGSTAACQSIDHVLVDTGSSGLRLMAGVLDPNKLGTNGQLLPPVTVSNAPLIECTQFASGYSWGSVRAADIKIANESTASLAPAGVSVQVIGDSGAIAIPSDCTKGYGTPTPAPSDSVTAFGANGILGVGLYVQDCGINCSVGGPPGTTTNVSYYGCPAGVCGNSVGVTNQQVSNPVSYFGIDNQGVILSMDFPNFNGAASAGAVTVQGTLTFGLNTIPPGNPGTTVAGANYLTYPGAQNVYLADTLNNTFFACITSVTPLASSALTPPTAPPAAPVYVPAGNSINAQASLSLIDSGSNAVFLPVPSGSGSGTTFALATDTFDWYSPATPVTIGAVMQNAGSTTCNLPSGSNPVPQVYYTVQNADTLFALNNQFDNAFYGLGGPNALPGQPNLSGIDFGLPFFYGKSIAVAIEAVPSTGAASGFGANNVYVPAGGTIPYAGPFWSFLLPTNGG